MNILPTIMNVELIGCIAGLISTISFFPQVLKVWKTNSTKGLSLLMYIFYVTSLAMWGAYAWLIESYSLLITEVVTGLFVGYILIKMLKELVKRDKGNKKEINNVLQNIEKNQPSLTSHPKNDDKPKRLCEKRHL